MGRGRFATTSRLTLALMISVLVTACGPNRLNAPFELSAELKRQMFTEPQTPLTNVPANPAATPSAYEIYEVTEAHIAANAQVTSLSARAVIRSSAGRETVNLVGALRADGTASLADIAPLASGRNRMIGEAVCADVGHCRAIVLNLYYNVSGRVLRRQFVSGELLTASSAPPAPASAPVSATDNEEFHESEIGLSDDPGADDDLGQFVGAPRNEALIGTLVERPEDAAVVEDQAPSELALDPGPSTGGASRRPAPATGTRPLPTARESRPAPARTPTPPTSSRPESRATAPARPQNPPSSRPAVPSTRPSVAPVVPIQPARPSARDSTRPSAPAARPAAPSARPGVRPPTTPSARPPVTPPASARPPVQVKPPTPAAQPTQTRPAAPPALRPAAPAPRPPAPRPAPRAPERAETPNETPNPDRPIVSIEWPVPPASAPADADDYERRVVVTEARLAPLMNLRDGGVSVGSYGRGRLRNASLLPRQGAGFRAVVVTPNSHYGSGMLVSFLQNAAAFLTRQLIPGLSIYVGDMSKRPGGRYGGRSSHHTHQNGLDADIAYLGVARPLGDTILNRSGHVVAGFDFEKTWNFLRLAFRQRLVMDGRTEHAVGRIFMSPAIKRGFCEWARETGRISNANDIEMLRYIWRVRGHHKHFHLNLKCSPHYPLCRTPAPPPPGPGCG